MNDDVFVLCSTRSVRTYCARSSGDGRLHRFHKKKKRKKKKRHFANGDTYELRNGLKLSTKTDVSRRLHCFVRGALIIDFLLNCRAGILVEKLNIEKDKQKYENQK